tara:strand:+ start:1092 stop:1796 length:705 start_codon:yes stop_codon:yes gene_type:complete
MNKKIVITGGSGRFGKELKKIKTNYEVFYPSSKSLDITKEKSIKNYLKRKRPKILIHIAGLSRPMVEHEKNISKSIKLNIIGTANVVKVCAAMKIKLVYVSTGYVYPGKKGNYKENDPLLPWNNYGWSKLGGESSVQMYKNSLILRVNISQSPFIHKKAFQNIKINFLYQDEAAKVIFKLINKKGIINLGGNSQSIYNFAKRTNPSVKKVYLKSKMYPRKLTMNLNKLRKIVKI